MKERILSELGRIERDRDVRILLAVESGSRAWGFASPDSDYDVRFVYAHRRDWYLSVQEPRDVIEEMLPGDLDVSGWELRKTLRLFAKCNLALNEWLGSPISYVEVPEFRAQLASLVGGYFNPIAGTHHYRKMAERALEDNYRDGGIGIKKIFYVLRPLLACRWIANCGTQPPTEFSELSLASWVSNDEREWFTDLLRQKAVAIEAQTIELESSRAESLRKEIDRFAVDLEKVKAPGKSAMGDLDRLLRVWVER
jgi:predicted nucleotidyltransferase